MTKISTFDYKKRKKTNIILQESSTLAICHLWGYCTSNAMTTFDRQSIPGILEVCSGVPLYKI